MRFQDITKNNRVANVAAMLDTMATVVSVTPKRHKQQRTFKSFLSLLDTKWRLKIIENDLNTVTYCCEFNWSFEITSTFFPNTDSYRVALDITIKIEIPRTTAKSKWAGTEHTTLLVSHWFSLSISSISKDATILDVIKFPKKSVIRMSQDGCHPFKIIAIFRGWVKPHWNMRKENSSEKNILIVGMNFIREITSHT